MKTTNRKSSTLAAPGDRDDIAVTGDPTVGSEEIQRGRGFVTRVRGEPLTRQLLAFGALLRGLTLHVPTHTRCRHCRGRSYSDTRGGHALPGQCHADGLQRR